MQKYNHFIRNTNIDLHCKERGISNGIAKLWEHQIVALGKADPSLVCDDLAEFTRLVEDIQKKTGRNLNKESNIWSVTVSADYTNSSFDTHAFIYRCAKMLSYVPFHDVKYTIEVGKHAYDSDQINENVHAHFWVKTKQVYSKVEQKFRESFRKFIGCKQAILIKALETDDIKYLLKMYPAKAQFLSSYNLKTLYTKYSSEIPKIEEKEKIKSFHAN